MCWCCAPPGGVDEVVGSRFGLDLIAAARHVRSTMQLPWFWQEMPMYGTRTLGVFDQWASWSSRWLTSSCPLSSSLGGTASDFILPRLVLIQCCPWWCRLLHTCPRLFSCLGVWPLSACWLAPLVTSRDVKHPRSSPPVRDWFGPSPRANCSLALELVCSRKSSLVSSLVTKRVGTDVFTFSWFASHQRRSCRRPQSAHEMARGGITVRQVPVVARPDFVQLDWHSAVLCVHIGTSLSAPWCDSSSAQQRVLSSFVHFAREWARRCSAASSPLRCISHLLPFVFSTQLFADDLVIAADCKVWSSRWRFKIGVGPTNSAVVVLVPRNRPPCDVSLGGSSLWKELETQKGNKPQEQEGKKVCDREKKNTSMETREQSTDEQDMTCVLHEVRGRKGVGLDDRRRMDETSGKAKEKGTEVKGNMGAKEDFEAKEQGRMWRWRSRWRWRVKQESKNARQEEKEEDEWVHVTSSKKRKLKGSYDEEELRCKVESSTRQKRASLARNGFSLCWHCITHDSMLILASEAGELEVKFVDIVEKGHVSMATASTMRTPRSSGECQHVMHNVPLSLLSLVVHRQSLCTLTWLVILIMDDMWLKRRVWKKRVTTSRRALHNGAPIIWHGARWMIECEFAGRVCSKTHNSSPKIQDWCWRTALYPHVDPDNDTEGTEFWVFAFSSVSLSHC